MKSIAFPVIAIFLVPAFGSAASNLTIGPPATLLVPGQYSTIQEAINEAMDGDTISIASGIYNENITIFTRNNLTIQGEGKDSTTINGDDVNNTVEIIFSKGIKLIDLCVQNGFRGVDLWYSEASIINCKTEDNNHNSIELDKNSSIDINNTLIQANEFGLHADANSTVKISNSNIINNTSFGIAIVNQSYGQLIDNTITGNGDPGAMAYGSSRIELEGNQINTNDVGLRVGDNSSCSLNGGNQISSNNQGITLHHNSSLRLNSSDSDELDQIHDNTDEGILLSDKCVLVLQRGSVNNNGSSGITLSSDSAAEFNASSSVTNNTDYGLECKDSNDSKYNGMPGDTSGNGISFTNCTQF